MRVLASRIVDEPFGVLDCADHRQRGRGGAVGALGGRETEDARRPYVVGRWWNPDDERPREEVLPVFTVCLVLIDEDVCERRGGVAHVCALLEAVQELADEAIDRRGIRLLDQL